MIQHIQHRGPDGSGTYSDSSISMGTCRLAMVDSNNALSVLSNEDNTIHLAYNGEIYNAPSIRSELETRGHSFKSASDGEIIVHLYEDEGENFLSSLDGMFAFALWDSKNQTLLLARDRMGIKPLYYYLSEDQLLFSSELKAILLSIQEPLSLNQVAIDQYLRFRTIFAPHTIAKEAYKLEPGSYLVANSSGLRQGTYWEPSFGQATTDSSFKELFISSVQSTALCDHRLGVFLSGGLDSSAIMASLAKTSYCPHAFSIGYETSTHENETHYASIVAKHLNCQHLIYNISDSDIASTLAKAVWHLDEPIYSTVSVSTYALAKFTSPHIKGVMTGDGSDELLLGYNYLLSVLEAQNRGESWKQAYENQVGWLTPAWRSLLLNNPSWHEKSDLLSSVPGDSWLDKIRFFEIKYRLPDYHLCRMDRLSMANGIEARVPFLRNRVVEWICQVKSDNLLIPNQQKQILKESFLSTLPKQATERKKKPFTSPYLFWIQHLLKSDARDVLLGNGYHLDLGFNYSGLEILLKNLEEADYDHLSTLWGVYLLFKWYDVYHPFFTSKHAHHDLLQGCLS